jgi:ribonuclease P protein component
VREQGQAYSHPLVVLIALPNPDGKTRIGVAAGRSVGKAVERNRAKRRLRAAVAAFLPGMRIGWDVILIARSAIRSADYMQIQDGIRLVLKQAGLLLHESEVSDDRA